MTVLNENTNLVLCHSTDKPESVGQNPAHPGPESPAENKESKKEQKNKYDEHKKKFYGFVEPTFITDFCDKDCLITLTCGRTFFAKIIKISKFEILVEEGKRNNKPVRKILFKHAIAKIEEK